MFNKILIANRGEIALRIIRSCKDLGIKSVAIYSEADKDALHTKMADEKIFIGPAISSKSYLNIENIIKAALKSKSDAIHPGYGYLAENDKFANECLDKDIVFIGPTANNLELLGNKDSAKTIMKNANVPVMPSSDKKFNNLDEAIKYGKKIGYPIMLKASGGGGGRGIRICNDEDSLREEYSIAKAEAKAAFDNDDLYIEKYIKNARHIEFQVIGDKYGNYAHLGERECTIQRRYQKLIEESPSLCLTNKLRNEMAEAALRGIKAVKYLNAGTVEFLLDNNGKFYFIEINARIQVEHPVTELTVGLDIVKEQIRIAAGGRIDYSFEDLKKRGWAIECRINAEDYEMDFMPSPGRIKKYIPPGGYGIRLDTHIYQGYEIPVYYDSLIAKVISFDQTRYGAIGIMKRALKEFIISPLKTLIPLYQQIMDDKDFINGEIDTNFINKFINENSE